MFLSIQYLRAIAVLLVLIYHTIGGFGAVGVDIFFVISGFIMIHIMSIKKRKFWKFLLARFLRIAPMYYISTLVVILLGISYDPTIRHIIYSLLFLKLPPWYGPVLSQGWTLEYEFVFYTICAISLLFINKLKGQIVFITFSILFLFGILDLYLFSERVYGHFIEFLFGIGIFLFYKSRMIKKINSNIYILMFIIGFILMFISRFILYQEGSFLFENNYLYLRFIFFGIPSFLVVLSLLGYEFNKGLKNNKILLLIGNASYSIYLTHLIIGFFILSFLGISGNDKSGGFLLYILLDINIGILIYLYIEKPINNYIKQILGKND